MQYELRVYYEDTDAGGVVYYANYLKFAERARTEMLRKVGIQQHQLVNEHDIIFIVRHAEMDFKAPARLDDELSVYTAIEEIKPASLIMQQSIQKGDSMLCNVRVKIACVSSELKPTALPKDLLEKFSKAV